MKRRRVYVNEAFRPQRVSGQQRYAHEISARLPPEFVHVAPGTFWSRSSIRTWLWTLTILPLRTWRGVLISMTARSPWYHPRHVLVVHDLFVIDHPEWFSRSYYWTHAPLLRFQLRTARALIAVSAPVAEQVQGLGARAVAVAPNAPSTVFVRDASDAEEVLHRHGLARDHYLLVVGNLEPRKNLSRLAAAYGMLAAEERSELPLVVVGGDAAIFQSTEIRWPEGTRHLGYVEDSELRVLYANSRAIVFPSLAEGFGLPIVEAVAAGATRLLLSDIPVFRWIAGEFASYFSPESVESLYETLATQTRARTDVPTVSPEVMSSFTWDSSAERLARAVEPLRRHSLRRRAEDSRGA